MNNPLKINSYLIFESIAVFALLAVLANLIHLYLPAPWRYLCYAPVLLMQGFWFDRFYIVGHEAAHRKLFPDNGLLNDIWGSIILLPLMVPLRIYRKIHSFHHGFNRRDEHTSVLDVFVAKRPPTLLAKIYYHIVWYLSVFGGGFFLHSLISVLLFLFVPVQWSERISPAFKGWRWVDQLWSIAQFGIGILFHLSFYWIGGLDFYLWTLGFPMLAFAWIWSMLIYVFHYDTTIGEEVRYNVRSLPRQWFFSWVLMNFNEHATHHQHPNIPWYELPEQRKELPDAFKKNQKVHNLWQAIFAQFKGPIIVYKNENTKS